MGTTVLRPTTYEDGSTNYNDGFTSISGGSATRIAAWTDNNDATDVRTNFNGASMGNGTYVTAQRLKFVLSSLPAGSQLRAITQRFRHRIDAVNALSVSGISTLVVDSTGQSAREDVTASTTLTTAQTSSRTTTVDGSKSFASMTVAEAVAYVNAMVGAYVYRTTVTNGPTVAPNIIGAEFYLDVLYNEAPVATAAAGFTATTSRPTFSFTYSDPDGDAQAGFRVRVFDSTTYSAGGFDPLTSTAAADSGFLASTATSWQCTTDLANGVTYRAFFIVSDTGSNGRTNSVTTAGPYQQVAVNLTPPNAPTITATTENATRRVRLDISATNNLSATATRYRFEVQRSIDGGTTWSSLSRLQSTTLKNAAYMNTDYSSVASPSVTLYDYESPFGSVTYRARVQATNSGNALVSTWSSTTSATVALPTRWWLKSLRDATLNVGLFVNSDAVEMTSTERQAVNYLLGRRNPVILADALGGESFPLQLSALDEATFTAFEALRATQTTLILENLYGDRLYVRLGATRGRKWVLNGAGTRRYQISVTLIEQDQPA